MKEAFRYVICVFSFVLCISGLSVAEAESEKKVSLMIYLDLSPSMNDKRAQVAAMADHITKNLEIQCGDYEIGVSNILYQDAKGGGGELIAGQDEPKFITKHTPKGRELLKQRIQIDNEPTPGRAIPPYSTGIQEITYSSVAATLANHLKSAPSQLKNSLAVGTLILSDAAPFYEVMSPDQAIGQIHSQLGSRPFIAGALGAGDIGRCLDAPPIPMGGDMSDQRKLELGLLKDFTDLSGGYYWNMCRPLDIEQTVQDFILMLMEKAGCMLIS